MAAGFKVTLHHVAARAQVSIATVSRALNGLRVAPEKLERVRKAVEELGYVANEAARSLRIERTMTVGMLFVNIGGSLEVELLDSLAGALGVEGYSLLVSTARGDEAQYDLLMRRFLERRIDALICLRPTGQADTLGRYLAAGVPVLAMGGRSGAFADLPLLYPSASQGALDAVNDLVALGHRHVGLLSSNEDGGVLRAVKTHLTAQGLVPRMLKMVDPPELTDHLAGWLKGPDRPTAIVTPYREAVGLMQACDALGVTTPRDLSVIALMSQESDAFHVRQPFSAIIPHPELLSRAVADTLLRWLLVGEEPPHEQRIETGVYASRATTGPVPRP